VNLLDDNIDTIKKNTQTLIDSSKVVGLEVNAEKTKYMLLSRHQNAGQNQDIKIGNRWFENMAQFRYLGTTITNQNLIQEKVLPLKRDKTVSLQTDDETECVTTLNTTNPANYK
jgi:hypothetical protein